MNHFRGETCKKGRETGEEGACVPRFWQFGEQEFVFRVVFIGPQVFKTKDANDSEGLGYGLRPVVNVLESLSLRIGYAKRMLVAVTDQRRKMSLNHQSYAHRLSLCSTQLTKLHN